MASATMRSLPASPPNGSTTSWFGKLTIRSTENSDIIVFVAAGDKFIAIIRGLIVASGDDVAAGEPAVEVHVSAALGAEGLVGLDGGLAADGAFPGFGHQTPERLDWLSQLKWTG